METPHEELLTNDFLFLLEMRPLKSFPPNSNEENLASKWLNYLCTYKVEDLNDRRLKNIYMSHLISALIQRRLYGPFLREPFRGRLENIDFVEETACANAGVINRAAAPLTKQCLPGDVASKSVICNDQPFAHTLLSATNTYNTSESQGLNCVSPTSYNVASGSVSANCPCPHLSMLCQCPANSHCKCQRSKAGADKPTSIDEEALCNYLMQELNLTPGSLNEFDVTLNSLMDLISVASLASITQAQSQPQSKSRSQVSLHDYPSNNQTLQGVNTIPEIQEKCTTPTSCEKIIPKINKLLLAISAELKGDAKPGSNVYLDFELARYRNFVMEYSDIADYLNTLTCSTKLRNCLLLYMQKDLVKLLKEEKSQINMQPEPACVQG